MHAPRRCQLSRRAKKVEAATQPAKEAAPALGLGFVAIPVEDAAGLPAAFQRMKVEGVDGFVVLFADRFGLSVLLVVLFRESMGRGFRHLGVGVPGQFFQQAATDAEVAGKYPSDFRRGIFRQFGQVAHEEVIARGGGAPQGR